MRAGTSGRGRCSATSISKRGLARITRATQHTVEYAQYGIGQLGDAGRFFDVPALVQILAVEEADEFRVL